MSQTLFKSFHNEVDLIARVTERPIVLQNICSDAVQDLQKHTDHMTSRYKIRSDHLL